MRARVVVAGFSHETNTFAQRPTTREDFQDRSEYVGSDIVGEFRGTNSTIGGAIDAAEEAGIELVPIVSAAAQPGGPVAREAYEHYTTAIIDGIQDARSDLDGVFLSLHGAMVPEGMDDGEGPLLSAVREEVGGDVPIVATLDLHGNVTDEMVQKADALVAYRTYPHVDTGATGRRAMALLLDTIRGDIEPTMAIERPPVVAFTPRQFTGEGPMAEIMARARAVEEDAVLVANVLPGFSHADVPSMGCSIVVVADGDGTAAARAARSVGEAVWERRDRLIGDYPDPESALARAIELIEQGATDDGPVVLADTGDNPGGGSPADGTVLLRAFLQAGVTNAGVAIIRDPEAVAATIEAGVGARTTLRLGAKSDDLHGDPLEDLEVTVRTLTDGRFRNTGPMGTGTLTRLGRTARLSCDSNGAIEVIVTELRVQPLDAEIWRHVGIQPERLDAIAVKSSNHYRAAYEPLATAVIPVATPGLTAVDPRSFTFENIRRPQFPFDEMETDAYP